MPTVRYTVMDGEIVSENRNGTIRDYVPDPLGSTIALLDQNQNITDTFSYWPYGEERTRTGTTPTPFRFVGPLGYYRDSSGRTYVRAREYQQAHGRWMTEYPPYVGADSRSGSGWAAAGGFSYSDASPVTLTEPAAYANTNDSKKTATDECATYVCLRYGFEGRLKRFIATHKFVCAKVPGKNNDCGGGLYPGKSLAGEPGVVGDWEYRDCDELLKRSDMSCRVINRDCAYARAMCGCINDYRAEPPTYNLVTSNCLTFVAELACCACLVVNLDQEWRCFFSCTFGSPTSPPTR